MGSRKGGQYERDFCTDLSRWWTSGRSDSVFWRIGGSGGRARVRGRKGKATDGQHGDVTYTDPAGKPLIDLFTIELKRGYNKTPGSTFTDLLDHPKQKRQKLQLFETWLVKCVEASEHAGTPYWMLVHKRDNRAALVFFPMEFLEDLRQVGSRIRMPGFGASVRVAEQRIDISGCRLDRLLTDVDPGDVKTIARYRCKGKK